MLKVGFIGAGTVGTALAVRLSQQGYPVVTVASQRRASAEGFTRAVGSAAITDSQGVADSAELVFITTPDGAIPTVASSCPAKTDPLKPRSRSKMIFTCRIH